jgi:hypothetical protein
MARQFSDPERTWDSHASLIDVAIDHSAVAYVHLIRGTPSEFFDEPKLEALADRKALETLPDGNHGFDETLMARGSRSWGCRRAAPRAMLAGSWPCSTSPLPDAIDVI